MFYTQETAARELKLSINPCTSISQQFSNLSPYLNQAYTYSDTTEKRFHQALLN